VILDKFSHPEGRTLAYHQEAFYLWDGTAYRPDPNFEAVTLVNETKAELDRQNVAEIIEWNLQNKLRALANGSSNGRNPAAPQVPKVTRVLVGNVAQALAALVSVGRSDGASDPPFWVRPEPGDDDPLSLIPARNGLVKLGRRSVVKLAHTPRLFSTYSLPYDYDHDAPEPVEWLRFLRCQWGNDPESIRELQKWFGLVLSPDISHQKILLLFGPPRSGRSTIRDLMTKLIGPRNVVTTSPAAMSDRFGLENFPGKTLAVMGDARTGDTHDTAILMDRLLRISGADPVEINRKGRSILEGVLLRTRFVIVANEIPNFRDNSGAIVARYIPLLMKETFFGKEDLDLSRRLEAELPSVLKWAIQGRAGGRGRRGPSTTARSRAVRA
jgi:putative DNA primase/helicase